MLHPKPINFTNLSAEQRSIAVQRLTALWAFCESGLGGFFHTFQFPFTGLIIGGLAMINISLITKFAGQRYSAVLQSLVVVLVIKAMVSPFTPFTAYIAVSFQAIMGYVFYRILGVNLLSILLLCFLTMLESAIQKLLLLTFFFGKSLWKAVDEMMDFITRQPGFASIHGSRWLITVYLFIHLLGGILVALMTWQLIKSFTAGNNISAAGYQPVIKNPDMILPAVKRKGIRMHLLLIILVMLILSVLLFVFAADVKNGWMAVFKTFTWTITAILSWYLLISPLFTRLLLRLLKKKESKYGENISRALAFIPVLRPLTAMAWKESSNHKGWKRIYSFFFTLLHWSLVYTDQPNGETTHSKPL